jgi:two-component system response regulator
MECDGYRMDGEFTILVAEDDANDRKLFHLALQRIGTEVKIREVTDGTDVRDYLEGNRHFGNRGEFPLPNLLIVDLKMPKMDGLDVIKWIRKEAKFARLPIVMLSGSGMSKDVAEAYRLGVNSYVQKPDDFVEFVRKLRLMIDYWQAVELPERNEL